MQGKRQRQRQWAQWGVLCACLWLAGCQIFPSERTTHTGTLILLQEMTLEGNPSKAIEKAYPLLQKEKLNWDPNLWALVAEAESQIGNEVDAAKHRKEATQHAEALSQALESRPPKDITEQVNYAFRWEQLGNYYGRYTTPPSRALTAFENALKMAPGSANVLNALGYALAEMGTRPADYERAVQMAHRAVQIESDNPSYLDTYGWALYKRNKKGDLVEAIRMLRAALEQASDASASGSHIPFSLLAEVRYHLGKALMRDGQWEAAQVEIDRALILRSRYPEARRAREEIAQKLFSAP